MSNVIYCFEVSDKSGSTLSFVESENGIACSVDGESYSVRLSTRVETNLRMEEVVQLLG